MSHPARYDPDDPLLARLRAICLALPEAVERISHGHPNWHTKTSFAYYGAVVKGDHDSDRYARSVLVKPEPDEREPLLADARIFVPAYLGASGWLGLDLLAAEPDWEEISELVESSYRLTAPARLVRTLDEP